ncbi:MAG: glycosyltransferase family 4 protein, partial [Planctomycetes bacterium]|nr:glycosyltransferase family 4 protein [Planctomycetota bacterium]
VALGAGLAARGVESFLVCPPGPVAEAGRRAGLPVDEVPMRSDLDLVAAAALGRRLARVRPQVVHAHSSRALAVSLAATALRPGGPDRAGRVLTRRVARGFGRPAPLGLRSFKFRRWADRIVAISQAVRERLVADGIPETRIRVVPSGVGPVPAGPAERARARAALGLPDLAPAVGVVAHLVAEKAVEEVLAAFARVRERLGGALLVVVGDGPRGASLRARAGPGVRFVGHREGASRLACAFDVVAAASRLEGLSLALVEAQAAGVPVAAYAAGGIPEAVAHGETGLLVPVGDVAALARAILALLDPRTGRPMGEAAARRARASHGVEAMVAGNLAVYREVRGG